VGLGRRRAHEQARGDLVVALAGGDRLSHRPDELSGGQQQRDAKARSLVNQPALVLADKPTGAVDTQTAAELASLMRRLNTEEGVTFILVTHDLELAAKTDRMIRLQDGRVVADEAVADAAA
jgi:ABC-type lipoprotein export system ATPase subunit